MNRREKIYQALVNRVPGIQERYLKKREKKGRFARVGAWIYLLALNFAYYVLRRRDLARPDFLEPDRKKNLPAGSESGESLLPPPEELAAKLAEYDVVTFDVFDTLLLRTVDSPKSVFYFAGADLDYPDFRHIRAETERKARRKKYPERGWGEVTFDEIWDLMEEETGIPAEAGKKAEWEEEMKNCRANPYFLPVVRGLLEKGKKVLFLSDMYFDSRQIRLLLEHAGYPPLEGFSSCEEGKSKSDGGLFTLVKEACGPDCSYIHIGDNPTSDQTMARRNGFSVFPYTNVNQAGNPHRCEDLSAITGSVYRGLVNARLHCGLEACSKTYEFGFVYGGLFVYGYCRFIHDYVQKNGIERTLFLARDGDVLMKAYLRMYPEEKDRCSYVLWSRIAGTRMTADYFKYDYFRRFLYHKLNQNYSLAQIFGSMELSDLLPGFLAQSGGRYTEKSVLDQEAADEVRHYLSGRWEDVLSHYEEESEAGRDYYSQILRDCRSAAAVDIGWAGSGALSLHHMVNRVWGLDCRITGIVAGTNSAFTQHSDSSEPFLQEGEMVSYLFSQAQNRDVWKKHNPGKDHNVIMELLLASDLPSFRKFSKDGPVFSEKTGEIDAEEVQRGVLDFVDLVLSAFGTELNVSGRDAMAPVLLLYDHPEWLSDVIRRGSVVQNLD